MFGLGANRGSLVTTDIQEGYQQSTTQCSQYNYYNLCDYHKDSDLFLIMVNALQNFAATLLQLSCYCELHFPVVVILDFRNEKPGQTSPWLKSYQRGGGRKCDCTQVISVVTYCRRYDNCPKYRSVTIQRWREGIMV
jgi:hypothetical protein